MVYVREFEGEDYNFGVIGVDKGTLILYDEESRSRWSQLFGEAIEGPMKGEKLEKLPSTLTTWSQWRTLHPETTVYVKRSIPYRARFTAETFKEQAEKEDGPLEARDLVVAVEGHVETRAYPLRRLASRRLVHDRLEKADILVYLSEDLASVRVYDRSVGERVLTFSLNDGGRLLDDETGSEWDPMTGEALSGALEGQQLQPFISTYSLWFAWQKYRPDTVIYGEGPS